MGSNTVLRNARIQNRSSLVDIAIEDGRIASIGPAGTLMPGDDAWDRVLDLEGRLVIQGMVNGHAHLDKALLDETASAELRYVDGYLEGPGLTETKAEFTHEDVKRRARQALRWAIATGTTAIRTHIDIDPYAKLTGLEAILELKQENAHLVDIQIVGFPQEGFFREPKTRDIMEEACKMGVDLIGGKPSADPDFKAHLDVVCELAEAYDRGIDVHIDTSMDPDYNASTIQTEDGEMPAELEVVYLAQKTREMGFQGRVTASHLCALSAVRLDLSRNVIRLLRDAGVAVIINPLSNLYWGARGDEYNVRRGIAPIHELMAAGVLTAYATDNFRDAWNLYSSPDMLIHGLFTAVACHMTTPEDLWTVVQMATDNPAKILGLTDFGLAEGRWADLVVLETDSLIDAMTRAVPRSYVFRHGEMAALTHEWQQVFGP